MGGAITSVIIALAGASPTPPPTPRQLAWQELEFTGFIHFGPNTFLGNEWGHGTEDPRAFAPTELDAHQWVRAMKDAGMKGIVITAKHHDGFCLWPSKLSTHTVAQSPWRDGKGDVLRELSDACRAEEMKFGVYLSPWDRNNPAYGSGEPYNEYFRSQLREVLSNYGPIHEVWFDGACGEGPNGRKQVYDFESFVKVVRDLQPDAVIFSDVGPDIRWVGNESGHAGDTNWCSIRVAGHGRGADNPPPTASLWQGDEDGEAYIPAECDVSIRPGWFWHADQNEKVKTPRELFDLWERSVGHNANLHLNVPPDRRGLLHERDVAALKGLRLLVDATYGRDLAAGAARVAGASGGKGEPTLTIEVPAAVDFDRISLQEELRRGQHVRRFTLECRQGGTWRAIFEGTTIGHRRIARVPMTHADGLRLTIHDSPGAEIRAITLHRTPSMDSTP